MRINKRGNEYSLQMIDGYITPPLETRWLKNSKEPLEQTLASRLASNTWQEVMPPGHDPVPPYSLHTWFVGNEGWLENAPEAIRAISETETDPSYRILILGYAPPCEFVDAFTGLKILRDHPSLVHREHQWMNPPFIRQKSIGMNRVKKHKNRTAAQEAGGAILSAMHDQYRDTRQPGSVVLSNLGVPFALCDRSP